MDIYILAFCSVISSIGVFFMFISSLFPMLFSGCFLLLCGFFVYVVGLYFNKKIAFCVYFVISTLSFFLVNSKRYVMIYILFAGIYPIFKLILESFKHRVVVFILKCLLFFFVVLVLNLFLSNFSVIFLNIFLKSKIVFNFKYKLFFIFIFLFCFLYDRAIDELNRRYLVFFKDKLLKKFI